jgi:hypothetical protein
LQKSIILMLGEHGLAFEYNLVKSQLVLFTIQFIILLIDKGDQPINADKRGIKQLELHLPLTEDLVIVLMLE